jgi:hypothetical protein
MVAGDDVNSVLCCQSFSSTIACFGKVVGTPGALKTRNKRPQLGTPLLLSTGLYCGMQQSRFQQTCLPSQCHRKIAVLHVPARHAGLCVVSRRLPCLTRATSDTTHRSTIVGPDPYVEAAYRLERLINGVGYERGTPRHFYMHRTKQLFAF